MRMSAAFGVCSLVLVSAGCDPGDSCVIDSDCRDWTAVCVDGTCQVLRAPSDGGDAGPRDAGPGDAGPADAGPGDAGPEDAGAGMCALDLAMGIQPLPGACLPRCSAETSAAVGACPADDIACVQTALAGDATPAIELMLTGGEMVTLDCLSCVGWQRNSCLYDACPTESLSCAMCGECDATIAGCEAEEMALETCRVANTDTVAPCTTERALLCLGS